MDNIPRGVKVRLIVDDSNVGVQGSMVGAFRAKGAFVRSKHSSFLMHHKFCIVDNKKLISGSFNWTMQAVMGNKENVIVTEDPKLVRGFVQEFEELWQEVVP